MHNREVVEESRLIVEVVGAIDEMGRELTAVEILGVAISVRDLEPRMAKRADGADVGPAVKRALDNSRSQADAVNDPNCEALTRESRGRVRRRAREGYIWWQQGQRWHVSVTDVYAQGEAEPFAARCGNALAVERGSARESQIGCAHRHLGGAERSPHPPRQDRVSHGIRQEESTAHAKASSVDEGRPACAQAPWPCQRIRPCRRRHGDSRRGHRCIPRATRNGGESRSVGEERAHHGDDEERPRRLTVEPSMLGYARGISCSARSRRRTALDGETVDAWLYQRHQLPHRQQQAAHHDVQPQEESPTRRRAR